MENLPTTEEKGAEVSTPVVSEPVKTESHPVEKTEEKPERKQSLKANLRSNLRQKDSETEAAKPSGQVSATTSTVTAEDFEAVLPPPDMNAQERAQWDSLSRDAQKYLSRRAYEMRSNFTKKSQEIGAREKELGSIFEAVTPI